MGLHVDDFGCVPDGQVLEPVAIAAGLAALGSPDRALGLPCQPDVIYGDALSTAGVEQPVASATVTATTNPKLDKHRVNQRCDDGECPACDTVRYVVNLPHGPMGWCLRAALGGTRARRYDDAAAAAAYSNWTFGGTE
jgi:hypothetical protein